MKKNQVLIERRKCTVQSQVLKGYILLTGMLILL